MKYYIYILIFLLSLPVVYALEFDNVLQTRDIGGKYPELTIVNNFGLGGDIAKFRLIENTDLCINTCFAIINVTLLENAKLPFEFDFIETTNEKYKNLNYNVYTQSEDEKDIILPTYKEVCNPYMEINLTLNNNCTLVQNGTYTSVIKTYDYQKYHNDILPSGNYIIKIESKMDEPFKSIDWSFNSLGISSNTIREHWAIWNSSFEVKLQRYYNFTNGAEYLYGLHNFTALEVYPTFHENNALKFMAVNISPDYTMADILNGGDKIFQFQYPEMTMNFWWRRSRSNTGDDSLLGNYQGGGVGWYVTYGNTDTLIYQYFCTGFQAVLGDRNWRYFMATAVTNITGAKLYINGTLTAQCNWAGGEGFNKTSSKGLAIGTYGDDASVNHPTGMMDELSFYNRTLDANEILDLYNNGLGLSIGDTTTPPVEIIYNFTIHHVSPPNNTNLFKNNSIDMYVNVSMNNITFHNGSLRVYKGNSIHTILSFNNPGENKSFIGYLGIGNLDLDTRYYWGVQAGGYLTNGTFIEKFSTNYTFIANSSFNVTNWLPVNNTYLLTTNTTTLKSNITYNLVTINNYSIYVYSTNTTNYFDYKTTYDIYKIIDSGVLNNNATDVNIIYNISLPNYQDYKWNVLARGQYYNGTYISVWGKNMTIIRRDSNVTFTPSYSSGYETENMDFTLNVTNTLYNPYESITARLVFNHSYYIPDTIINISDNWYFKKTLSLPNVISASNFTPYWEFEIVLNNSAVVVGFSASPLDESWNRSRIVVYNISIVNCTAIDETEGNVTINFTIRDEETNNRIEADLETFIDYRLNITSTNSDNLSNFIDNRANMSFCIIPANLRYYSDFDLRLSAAGYDSRNFNINNIWLSQTTTERTLYLLNESSGEEMILELKDDGLTPLVNYTIKIYRNSLITGGKILVEEQNSNFYGQVVADLIRNNVKYDIYVYNQLGNLVKYIPNSILACKTAVCTLPIVIKSDIEIFDIYDNTEGFECTISYNNNTRKFTYSWNDATGDSSTMRFLIKRYNLNNISVVYNGTSTDDSSLLQYIAPDEIASYTAEGYRLVNGKDSRMYCTNTEKGVYSVKVKDLSKTFGREGLFIAFILLFTLIIIGIYSPPAALALYFVGLIFLSAIQVITLTPTLIILNLFIVGAAIWFLKN